MGKLGSPSWLIDYKGYLTAKCLETAPKALTIRYPGRGGGGGGGGGVYRIENNNRALKFFEKNNCALKISEKNNSALTL